MIHQSSQEIAPGTVLEFFEAKRILCGVCLGSKNQRLSVLTEQNKEISLARSRVVHFDSRPALDPRAGRDDMVRKLQEFAAVRKSLMEQVDVEELWTLLENEGDGFSAHELAEIVFVGPVGDHHVAAVDRMLLLDRLYFQVKDGLFYPRSQEKVEQRRLEIEREEERESQLIEGSQWLQWVWQRKPNPPPFEHRERLIEVIKNFCAFGQDSPDIVLTKELFKRAGIPPMFQSGFRLLVRLGVWREDENIYLYQQGVSVDFPEKVQELAARIVAEAKGRELEAGGRRDLRDLHAFTIDSPLTRDYDDALSIRVLDGGLYEVGIHIADAAQFISRGDPIDQEAQERASSIYLPDGRIPMLPPGLSEDISSLRAGVDRPALSFLMRMDVEGRIESHEIVTSIVRVRENITYEEVNARLERSSEIKALHELSLKFREMRLARGAIILPLPEIHVYVNPEGMIQLSRYEKETPSQIMVSEWMIATNALAASFFAEHKVPAIFRSQAECKQETEPITSEHQIFHIFRQRRLFARAELDTEPRAHCSLGLSAYTSISSPIRRYLDLVMQRQIKHFLETGEPLYTEEALRNLLAQLGATQSKIFLIQRKWSRYWVLKYMEQEYIHTLNALVLSRNGRFAHLLLPDFLIEVNMPLPEQGQLQPGELIRVKVERVSPREDVLRLHI